MRILTPEEVHFQPTDMWFGPSKMGRSLVFLVFILISGIFLFAAFDEGRFDLLILLSIICAILSIFVLKFSIGAFKRHNWRMVIQEKTLLLKANIAGSKKHKILQIPYCEIVSLRKLRENYYILKRRKGGYLYLCRTKLNSLDIEITSESFGQHQRELQSGITGIVLCKTNRLVYPSQIHCLNTRKILKKLERFCRVCEDHYIKYDKPDLNDFEHARDHLLFLASRGHLIKAQYIARKAFGVKPLEAEEYVVRCLQSAKDRIQD